MSLTLEKLTPTTSIEVWKTIAARNNAFFWDWAPSRQGQAVAHWPEAWAADPAVLNPFPNSATLLRPLNTDGIQEAGGRLRAFYNERPAGPWLLWSAWENLDFTASGLFSGGRPPLMTRWPWQERTPKHPSELKIREVHDQHALTDWLDVLTLGYPAPELRGKGVRPLYDTRVFGGPLRLFTGYMEGQAVTCSASFTDEYTCGVFAVATLSQFRGRGYGACVTAAAASHPTLPAMLTASDLGRSVYASLGFEERFRFQIWFGHREGNGR